MKKRFKKWIFMRLFLFGGLIHFSISANAFKVFLDPGHGGADQGSSYQLKHYALYEKDLTLQIAKQVQAKLQRHKISVLLSRTQDTQVSLPDRAAIANQWGADLFISLHLNDAPKKIHPSAHLDIFGVETFILNQDSQAVNKRLHQIYSTKKDSTGEVQFILQDLQLMSNGSPSMILACLIQNYLVSKTLQSPIRTFAWKKERAKRDRGVRQALFQVLLETQMPSALVELGFLSHPNDRQWLATYRGQQVLSEAIKQAVLDYKSQLPSKQRPAVLSECKLF